MINPNARARTEVNRRVSGAQRDQLLNRPNVHSVGVGFVEVDGERTGEIGVIVSVENKNDLDDLPAGDRIPEQVNGIRVDVKERAHERLELTGVRGEQVRPIPGGVSGGGGGNGTIGGALYHDNELKIVTNRHIAADDDEDPTGDPFYQPDPAQSNSEQIGTVDAISEWETGDPFENVDAALISVNDAVTDPISHMLGVGALGDFAGATLGEMYVANGSRTGWISGECIELDVAISSGGRSYRDVVRFARETTQQSDWNGNSGTFHGRLDRDGEFHPVGLHFSGTDSNSSAMPFWRVSQAFSGGLSIQPTGGQSAYPAESPTTESCIRSAGDHPEGEHIQARIINTGGDATSPGHLFVNLSDANETIIDSLSLPPLDSMESRDISFVVPDGYGHGNEAFYLETSDSYAHEITVGDVDLGLDLDGVGAIHADGEDTKEIWANDGTGEIMAWESESAVTLGEEVAVPDSNDIASQTQNFNGLYCDVNGEIIGVRAEFFSEDYAAGNYDWARALDGNGNWISDEYNVENVAPGGTVDVYFDQPRTDDFGVGVVSESGDLIRARYQETNQFPYAGVEFDISAGVFNAGPSLSSDNAYIFKRLTPIL